MPDIVIERVNSSFIRVCTDDDGIKEDIFAHFVYKEPGFVKNRWTKWNGTVRLFKKSGNLLPYGCLMMLLEFAKNMNWTYEIDEELKKDITPVKRSDLVDWINTLDLRSSGAVIEPYDYQIDALELAVKFGRMVLLAATSAGKSLICYMLTRYYEMLCNDDGKKILIIVPSQMLVDQLYKDFQDYSSENGWNVEANVHKIMEGRPKNAKKMIYLSTWQSIYEEEAEYFEQFGRVINDECHLASGKSITHIMNSCKYAAQRVGMTGTLKADKIHPILVMSLFGPIKRVVTTKQLIDDGRATPVSVTMLQLNYLDEERRYVSDCSYNEEIEFLMRHKYRNKILTSLIASLKGNSIVLFDRLEHIETIETLLSQMDLGDRKVYVITGAVDRDEREAIKAIAEKDDGVILLGTKKCIATGISIKRLKNLIFAHPGGRAIITILQSVGRILRLHADKDSSKVYDFIDNLTYNNRPNSGVEHASDRYEFYNNDQFPITFKKMDMKLSNP